jgi:NAD(P)H-dependent FMN reductase
MKTLILDGSPAGDETGARTLVALQAELQTLGWEVQHMPLREKKIGNCAGDFFCWVRNPGICNVDDDNREVAAALMQAELAIYLTPVTFGGYSSTLKAAVDHQIQNIAPFFAKLHGETHHARRYEHYPHFLAIGWQTEPDAQAAQVFEYLVWRNALNFYAKSAQAGILSARQSEAETTALLRGWLNAMSQSKAPQPVQLPVNGGTGWGLGAPRRALLLVGSPRTRKSTSHSLGSYLFQQLGAASIPTETIFLHTMLRSPAKRQALLDAVEAADLVTLAFPLYVDSLPAPVMETLEWIAAHRQANPSPKHFAALANSGFPEPEHNAAALAICATFARQTGMTWAGGLALGAGEGMVHGAPLAEMDGRAIPLRKALTLAAQALGQGQAIPPQAQQLISKPFIPAWLYRFAGSLGWKQMAKRWGAQNNLRRKPYGEVGNRE